MPIQSRYRAMCLTSIDCFLAAAACFAVLITLPFTAIAALVGQRICNPRRAGFRAHE